MLADTSKNTSSGQLSDGVELDSSITAVVKFIEIYFSQFAEKIKGENTANEKSLTDKLCKYFNRNAGNYPFYFHHENIENPNSGKSPQIDIATLSNNERLVIGDRSYGEFDSFFSIEAKRLPTPGYKREKEYVIGMDKPCGGIERFKKGIHGKNLKHAAIIGYIQEKNSDHWYLKINNWIGELIITTPDFWKEDDKLIKLNSTQQGIHKFVSKGFRWKNNDGDDLIELFHFWISQIN